MARRLQRSHRLNRWAKPLPGCNRRCSRMRRCRARLPGRYRAGTNDHLNATANRITTISAMAYLVIIEKSALERPYLRRCWCLASRSLPSAVSAAYLMTHSFACKTLCARVCILDVRNANPYAHNFAFHVRGYAEDRAQMASAGVEDVLTGW